METKESPYTYLESWKNTTIKIILDRFEEVGEVHPMAYYIKGENEIGVIPLSWENEQDKDNASKALKVFAQIRKITAYVFTHEMYMIRRPIEKDKPIDYKNYERPSLAPDRVECLYISYETHLGAQTTFYEIKRDKDKPYLQQIMIDVPQAIGGRFTNFLSKPYGIN